MRIYLHPGFTQSSTDKNKQFITSKELADFYHVEFKKCYIIPYGSLGKFYKADGEVHLYPDSSGNYGKAIA